VLEPPLLQELGALRLRAARLFHRWEFGLSRSGLTGRERLALDVLAEHSSLTMGELARHCGSTRSTMTSVVDRLVQRRCVERGSPEWDRRTVHVWITPLGRDFANEHRQIHLDETRELFNHLTDEEREVLVRGYRRAVAALEAKSAETMTSAQA
jgi:DNA-binding MarR family transcriptional regulator